MSLSSHLLLLPIGILYPPIPQSNPRTSLFASPSPPSPTSSRFGALTCHASQFDRDESLWLREEQRWLREEQRWLREEQRWARERDALLRRVTELELRIQAMDRRSSVQADGVSAEVTETIAGLVETLKERTLIAETGSGASPMVLEAKENKKEKEKKIEDVVRDVAEEPKKEKNQTKKKKGSSLRIGSEGEEVRALQEALEKLGFYSGEEDMEFSSFSSGTELTVKTWQASLGAREDGIMTEDLLAVLFLEKVAEVQQKESSNGAAVSKSNIQKEAANEEVTQTRVFLLGENRWEEPSRLRGSRTKTATPTKPTTKCIGCRGEGRLLCTECDGTGEPNLEPQFMEWVDEGTKCPYCEGHGFTICDVCDGKPAL